MAHLDRKTIVRRAPPGGLAGDGKPRGLNKGTLSNGIVPTSRDVFQAMSSTRPWPTLGEVFRRSTGSKKP